jgi:2-C-methyl-D-erythritol 2,4-cyclodiphosphate synthase
VTKPLRVGQGYDVHRLTPGRPLVLGGVTVPYDKGLLGHSDADALTHAVMDALLGAAGLGDIGLHFPDTDAYYKDIPSLNLLREVTEKLAKQGWLAVNIDATVIAEQPRLAPFLPLMAQNIANALGIEEDAVNVKATTEEGLGFTGAGLGIAAQAVCIITK